MTMLQLEMAANVDEPNSFVKNSLAFSFVTMHVSMFLNQMKMMIACRFFFLDLFRPCNLTRYVLF